MVMLRLGQFDAFQAILLRCFSSVTQELMQSYSILISLKMCLWQACEDLV